MEDPTSSIYWETLMRRDGWLVVDVDDRNVGIVISVTDGGKPFLKVAGFHLGETMFVGERQERLSVKVERISADQQKEMLPKIHEALPLELRGLPIAFL